LSAAKTHILIIGGDGDLAIRKLYPALFSLESAGELGEVECITGLSRSAKDRSVILNAVNKRLTESGQLDSAHWDSFSSRLNFITGDATSTDDLKAFGKEIDLETTQLIVYFAIPPKVFDGVCRAMHAAGLVVPSTRVVVEKPLGTSCDSFTEIHEQMASIFNENQVYRIDHYLGKESVQNLLALRFANVIFSSIWNSDHIDSVQITVAETVGVEDRHEFYDEIGALRDMVQNHLLQILCLIALEPPANKNADTIRSEKLKVIQSLKPITLDEINAKTVRGQYAAGTADGELAPGYQDEIGRERESITETFVAIKAEIDNWRWAGVPFYLRTGKRLTSRCAEIVIQFKKPKHSIFAAQSVTLPGNSLHIRLQPDDGVQLRFLNKQPGLGELPLEELDLNLQEPDANRKHSFDAYARLLLEVLRGDQTLFVSSEEVVASWKWIDQIRANWEMANSKSHPYSAGTNGPSQAVVLIARDNREWTELSR
jgi:glucose-6-phosphate 1-dehydrogenase